MTHNYDDISLFMSFIDVAVHRKVGARNRDDILDKLALLEAGETVEDETRTFRETVAIITLRGPAKEVSAALSELVSQGLVR